MSVTLRSKTICPIVEKIDSLSINQLTTESVRQALEGLAHISAWADSKKLLLTRRLQELATASPSVIPAQVIASACGVTRSEAQRGVARVSTLDLVPQLETALTTGTVSVAHIDAVTQAMAHLSEPEKQQVAIQGDWINMVASHTTPDNFARAVRRAVQQIHTDAGLTQLEQQRRRTSCAIGSIVILAWCACAESSILNLDCKLLDDYKMQWSDCFAKEPLTENLDLPINCEPLVCVPLLSIPIPIPQHPLLLRMVEPTSV